MSPQPPRRKLPRPAGGGTRQGGHPGGRTCAGMLALVAAGGYGLADTAWHVLRAVTG